MDSSLGGSRQFIVTAGQTVTVTLDVLTHMLILEDATVNVTSTSWKTTTGANAAKTIINAKTLAQGMVIPVNATSIEVLTGTIMAW